LNKKALITGITGQDGSYLTELLLSKKYEVHGIIRRSSTFNTSRLDHIYQDPHEPNPNLKLHYGDITDLGSLTKIMSEVKPDEIYHLAAQSHVQVSFQIPDYTGDTTGLGTTRILEAIREHTPKAKFYQASSSEMFGNIPPPQNELSVFEPRSPYAAAKLHAYWISNIYREAYSLNISNGILFNHESPRRGGTFVTKKIARAVANIISGNQKLLFLGNLDASRDWGYAPEYVEAMWLIMQEAELSNYVIGTGQSYKVRDFVSKSFDYVGLDWNKFVKIDPRYFRPVEVDNLCADSKKAKKNIDWNPKVDLDDLVAIMIDAELENLSQDTPGRGKKILNDKFKGWHTWEKSGRII
jgi:GDPmannose 4,6-dehydratase